MLFNNALDMGRQLNQLIERAGSPRGRPLWVEQGE